MLRALNKLLARKHLPIGFKKMAVIIHLSPIGKRILASNLFSAHGIDLVFDLVAP